MAALLNKGGFDLVTVSGDASLRMVAGKRAQTSDASIQITNAALFDESQA